MFKVQTNPVVRMIDIFELFIISILKRFSTKIHRIYFENGALLVLALDNSLFPVLKYQITLCVH